MCTHMPACVHVCIQYSYMIGSMACLTYLLNKSATKSVVLTIVLGRHDAVETLFRRCVHVVFGTLGMWACEVLLSCCLDILHV